MRSNQYEQVGKVVGFVPSEGVDDEFTALQALINSGNAWRLEGSIGRAAMDAISAGKCLCGHVGHYDYWGNYVPARNEVKDGTKGSVGFVQEQSGDDWALFISNVK